MQAKSEITKGIIRSKLLHLINRREKAYLSIASKGHVVPGYTEKMAAIAAIRTQLNASRDWSLESNLQWIHHFHSQLIKILPSEFHDDPKQKRYRKHMQDLLTYCEDLRNSKPLFNLKPDLYGKKTEDHKNSASQRHGHSVSLWLFGDLFRQAH